MVQPCAKCADRKTGNKGRGTGVPQPFLFVGLVGHEKERLWKMVRKVAVIMGSDSDWPVVKGACAQLKALGIP